MGLTVTGLSWDSDFFGFGIGRITAPFPDPLALRATLDDAHDRQRLRLVYGFAPGSDTASRTAAQACSGRLVDEKLTYAGATALATGTPRLALAVPGTCTRRQLRTLTWQSAEHSRFRIDRAFPPGAWRKLYTRWLENSMNGAIADAVIVARGDGGRIDGMTTLAHRGDTAQIGLLAVHARARGRGLGRQLVMAALARAHDAGCQRLHVVTQGGNAAACALYAACGLELSDHQSIFHFWST